MEKQLKGLTKKPKRQQEANGLEIDGHFCAKG
jgi:hypothetical protein